MAFSSLSFFLSSFLSFLLRLLTLHTLLPYPPSSPLHLPDLKQIRILPLQINDLISQPGLLHRLFEFGQGRQEDVVVAIELHSVC